MDLGRPDQPTVTVLLSIYRAQEYLEQFLASLEAQNGVSIRLLYLLDDEDSSSEDAIRSHFPTAVRLGIPGGNGVPTAYLELLRNAPLESDYYCFADQDDIWLPGKLSRAVRALAGCAGEPTLWVSRVRPFREQDHLTIPGQAYPSSIPRPSWRHALVENVGPGCAMVWNRPLQIVLGQAGAHEGIMMHDWWVYAFASVTGRVILEPDPQVLYRLHDSNAVGIDRSPVNRIRRLVRGRSSDRTSLESQAKALLDSCRHRMTTEQISVVADIAGRRRFRKFLRAVRGDVYRTSRVEYPLLCGRMLWQ